MTGSGRTARRVHGVRTSQDDGERQSPRPIGNRHRARASDPLPDSGGRLPGRLSDDGLSRQRAAIRVRSARIPSHRGIRTSPSTCRYPKNLPPLTRHRLSRLHLFPKLCVTMARASTKFRRNFAQMGRLLGHRSDSPPYYVSVYTVDLRSAWTCQRGKSSMNSAQREPDRLEESECHRSAESS